MKTVLEFEKLYVDNLPCAEMYEKSYMHRDVITHVVVTPHTDFIVTARFDRSCMHMNDHVYTHCVSLIYLLVSTDT